MRRVVIRQFGGPENLELEDFEAPHLMEEEVLVEVSACGINFADLVIRLGIYPKSPSLPFVPGYEVAGTVRAVGSAVLGYNPGDRVVAALSGGGYASHVVCSSQALFHIPDRMSEEEAVALPSSYLAAWLAIDRLANVRKEEFVVIHSAGGSVGTAALQICNARQARVLGIASVGKHSRLLNLGAEVCVDTSGETLTPVIVERTAGRGADVVLDSTGGISYQRSYDYLAPFGRIILLGAAGAVASEGLPQLERLHFWHRTLHVDPLHIMSANRSISGLHLPTAWSNPAICRAGIKDLIRLFEIGQIKPIVDAVFSLQEARLAHRYIHERKNFGKVVLKP